MRCMAGRGCGYVFVSIHAPREGSDMALQWPTIDTCMFHSMLPGEGSDRTAPGIGAGGDVSIHAPVKGATTGSIHLGLRQFQSTLPAKGATRSHETAVRLDVSIHAPGEGSDVKISHR